MSKRGLDVDCQAVLTQSPSLPIVSEDNPG